MPCSSRGQAAGNSLMRLLVNTFMGLGGVLDVASEMQIERSTEDFGQTLGYWGVGAGPVSGAALAGALDRARHRGAAGGWTGQSGHQFR